MIASSCTSHFGSVEVSTNGLTEMFSCVSESHLATHPKAVKKLGITKSNPTSVNVIVVY